MKKTLLQILRFGLVGLTNAVVAYGLFALLLLAGMHFALATFLGGLAGMIVGFKLTGSLVFENREPRLITRFATVFALLYILNILIQKALHPWLNPYASGAVAAILCFFVSYALNRTYVFRRKAPMPAGEYGTSYAQVQIRRSSNPLRRLVRYFYLSDLLRHVQGASIDLGCGAGDLLARLPSGSMGLEINPAAVEFCRCRNLEASLYDPEADDYELAGIPPGRYSTLLLTHVLEHLPDPRAVLLKLYRSCARLGIHRIVLTVPCEKGFGYDATHRTYVDEAYLAGHGLLACHGFTASYLGYFPLNRKWPGKLYTFHELRIVLDHTGKLPSTTGDAPQAKEVP